MANLKNITDVPMAESAEGLNLIVNDNGAAKQIAASAVGAQADFAVTDESHPAFIKNKPAQVQPDWNQNDPTAPDYVKNRPFWADDIVETVLFDGTVENDADINIELIIGQEYIVTLDGVEYVLTARDEDDGYAYIGSRSLWYEEDYVDSEPPFVYGDGWFYTVNDGDTHTFTVVGDSSKIHMIDEKFIPFSMQTFNCDAINKPLDKLMLNVYDGTEVYPPVKDIYLMQYDDQSIDVGYSEKIYNIPYIYRLMPTTSFVLHSEKHEQFSITGIIDENIIKVMRDESAIVRLDWTSETILAARDECNEKTTYYGYLFASDVQYKCMVVFTAENSDYDIGDSYTVKCYTEKVGTW